MPQNQNQRIAQIIIAIIAWAALILQLYLQIINRTTDVAESIIRYFSYFTILTNIIVAICFTSLLMKSSSCYRFFNHSEAITSVTVYILIVGLVYNLVLRSLWKPQGLQLLVDNLLHTITPLLTLLYWFFFVSVKNIMWQQTYKWMLYPLLYLVYVIIRGSFSNFYPYFFIVVSKLGYAIAFINSGYVTMAFLVISFLLLWIGKKKSI